MKSALYTPEQNERLNLCFNCTTEGERCTVVVTNGLNEVNAEPLLKRVTIAITEGARDIRIDLSGCDAVQRIGYSMLYAIAQRAAKRGGCCTIVGATGDVRSLFDYWAIARAFRFDPSVVTP